MRPGDMNLQRKVSDLLGLLVRAPRTQNELVELTGMDKDTIRRWLRAFEDEGLLVKQKISRKGMPRDVSRPMFLYVWHPLSETQS